MVEDLVANDAHHLKRLLRADRVDKHVAVDANEVLGIENRVFILLRQPLVSLVSSLSSSARLAYLAGSVDDLGRVVLALDRNLFAEGVFNGRIVAFDKVAIDKLHCERGFACAPLVCRL